MIVGDGNDDLFAYKIGIGDDISPARRAHACFGDANPVADDDFVVDAQQYQKWRER